MAHPSDEELEAMAVDLVFFHPGETSELAAAMLRACKGRAVKPLPRGDGEGGWTLPVELLAEFRDEVYANEWDAPCAEVIEIIALSTEARILAAEAERDALRAELADAVEVLTLIESIRPMWEGGVRGPSADNLSNTLEHMRAEARAFLARHRKETDT